MVITIHPYFVEESEEGGQFYSGCHEDPLRIAGLLKACAKKKDLCTGSKLHLYIRKHQFLVKNCIVASSLVSMYAKCGALAKAQQTLNELPVRNEVIWNALIAGYAQQGQGEQALQCFQSMQEEGHSPNAVTFCCALKACGSIRAAAKGEEIHDQIVSLGLLEKNIALGNTLVDMYAKCGALSKAEEVLSQLPDQNVVAWNALITGYVQQGKADEALKCFDIMQREGNSPDAITFICALKACGSIGASSKGEKIHNQIVSLGMLEKNVMIGNTLVNMYARCGALSKAQQVLHELPVWNVVTWNALIAGYVQQGWCKEALESFDNMQSEGLSPDAVTFICALKACGSIRAAAKGEEIHDKILSLGMLEGNIALGNALVNMYAKCGALAKAQEALLELPIRDVVTWNSLMAGFFQYGQGEEVLKCFDNMQLDGFSPDLVTFIFALKACGSIGAAAKGEMIHDEIATSGLLKRHVELGNTLVDMYARCGVLTKAQQVLNELPIRDVVTWNILIFGYVQQGLGDEALGCFDSMQEEGYTPDVFTFTCALKACGSIGSVVRGEKIHGDIVSLAILGKDILLGSTLVDMYARCGALAKAEKVLNQLPVRDVVTWTALIAGYAQQGQGEEALKCFANMQEEGHSPDVVTFVFALKACGSIGAAAEGEKIHEEIVNLDMLEKDIVLGSALVDMYARCGVLKNAQKVLGELSIQDAVTWNALIGGYLQQGQEEEALKCFDNMQQEGYSPNEVTFACALKACGSIGAVAKGEKIHDEIASLGMLKKDVLLGNTLVDMYARCGALAKARKVLNELPVHDVFMWNVLMTGYIQQGKGEEALKCFDCMQHEGHLPDAVTFSSALKACGAIGAASKGEEIHDRIISMGMLEKDNVLKDSLMDMYVKCAALVKAVGLFKELFVQDAVNWNALMRGYAQQGQSSEALKCFKRMQAKGVALDSATFVCVLNACSHSGLVEEADMHFLRMSTEYGITPNAEHYCCMVDLLGRAGKLNKALAVMEKMPCAAHLLMWHALLGACHKWVDVKIGRFAFERALHLDKGDTAAYVCMANIYTAAGMHDDAHKIEVMKVANRAWERIDAFEFELT